MELRAFYERSYSSSGPEGETYARWRELSAGPKVAHVLELADELRERPARVIDVGCGDGSVIARLSAERPRWSLAGVEIAERAADLARMRCPEASIGTYDGQTLPFGPRTFDLAIFSHVVEHVVDPLSLLREGARVAQRLIVEVPLEANLSTRRQSKRRIARDVGHIQRFSRRSMRALVTEAGLRVSAERSDPLGRDTHRFFAHSRGARARADTKWLIRAAGHGLSTPLAQWLFTVHYACLCEPLDGAIASR